MNPTSNFDKLARRIESFRDEMVDLQMKLCAIPAIAPSSGGESEAKKAAFLVDWLGANGFVDINTWGTPQQILDKLEKRQQALGDFDLTVQVSYGGMSLENAESSMRLFAEKVLPEVQGWRKAA